MKQRTRAELWLLAVTIVWGSTFVITKSLLENVTPFAYVSIRFGIASVLFALMIVRKLRGLNKRVIVHGSILGALLFAGFATQTVGLQYTTASKSAFITGMMVIFTPICQILIERRAPRISNMVGVMLVAVGLYLLTSPDGSSFNVGDALTLVCAGTFAVYIVLMDIYGKEHDPSHLSLIQFSATFLFALLLLPIFETPRVILKTGTVVALGYLILLPTIVALYVQAKYQKDTTPTRSAIIFSVEPVLASGFAYVFLAERIGIMGVIGGAVILAGLLISELWDVLFPRTAGDGQEPG